MSADNVDRRTANLLGALGLLVGDLVSEASQTVVEGSENMASALVVLRSLKALNIDGLAGILGLTHSGAVRLVDRLGSEGLVERGPGVDGRSITLKLTKAGQRRSDQVLEARHEAVAQQVSRLDKGDRAELTRLLEVLLDGSIVTPDMDWHTCRLCVVAACMVPECPVSAAAERLGGGAHH